MQQHISDKELNNFFNKNNLKGTIHYHKTLNRQIRYIKLNNNCDATLFFIHGAPASLMESKEYFINPQLRNSFNMIAVDRPGYGRSGYGKPEPSIQKQADILKAVLDDCEPKRPLIIYAASYGAAIACKMLIDYPDAADGLVLMAPAIAPGKEKYFWLTPVIEHSIIRRLVPAHHRSSNTEKYHHKKELKKLLPGWKNIYVPVMYIQGKKDKMVYTSNAAFAREQLINVPWLKISLIRGQKHVINKRFNPFIIKKILDLYRQVKSIETEQIIR